MKLDQFYMVIGTVFLAPHLSEPAGVSAAAAYMAVSLWLGFRRKAAS